eukprot:1189663-Prorocentrum_minimum.AAC.2
MRGSDREGLTSGTSAERNKVSNSCGDSAPPTGSTSTLRGVWRVASEGPTDTSFTESAGGKSDGSEACAGAIQGLGGARVHTR